MRHFNSRSVLRIGKSWVTFDFVNFRVASTATSPEALDQIHNSILYRYFERCMLYEFCYKHGIDYSELVTL